MKDTKPLLFRFKKETLSPNRLGHLDENVEYDEDLDMVVTTENGEHVIAIKSLNVRKLQTKKADVEKNEDQKETLGWRRR